MIRFLSNKKKDLPDRFIKALFTNDQKLIFLYLTTKLHLQRTIVYD